MSTHDFGPNMDKPIPCIYCGCLYRTWREGGLFRDNYYQEQCKNRMTKFEFIPHDFVGKAPFEAANLANAKIAPLLKYIEELELEVTSRILFPGLDCEER